MSAQNTSSSTGPNSAGFSTGLDPSATQMPSTLGGPDASFSNLTGTGTAAQGGYQPMSPTMFTDSSASGPGMNMAQLQSSLGTASKIGQPTPTQPQMMRQGGNGGIRLPANSFSSGVTGAPVVGGSNGVGSLLALMQQRRG